MFYGTADGKARRLDIKERTLDRGGFSFLFSFLLGLSEKQLQCLTIYNILSWSVNFFHLLVTLPYLIEIHQSTLSISSRTLLLRYTFELSRNIAAALRWVILYLHRYPFVTSLRLQLNTSLVFRGIRTSYIFFTLTSIAFSSQSRRRTDHLTPLGKSPLRSPKVNPIRKY